MKASDKSAVSAWRSCMLLTTCSLVTPRCPISRRRSESGITPMTSPPLANAASAAAPIRPTQPPPKTMPILRSASSSPRRCAAWRYAGRAPGEEPQKTQIRFIVESEVPLMPVTDYRDSSPCFGIKTVNLCRHGEELVHISVHSRQLQRFLAKLIKDDAGQVAFPDVDHNHHNHFPPIPRPPATFNLLPHPSPPAT